MGCADISAGCPTVDATVRLVCGQIVRVRAIQQPNNHHLHPATEGIYQPTAISRYCGLPCEMNEDWPA
jgi:hypothetical protein